MALNNKLRKIVDQPVWEWMRYSPFSFGDNSFIVTPQAADTGSWQYRYLYAFQANNQWRYDTYSDAWSFMSNSMLPTSPASTITGVWKKDDGHVGRFISATSGSSTATGAFLNESAVVGLKIKVISGKGRGAERTIINSTKPVTVEYMTLTGYSNSGTGLGHITDTSKKWIPNQWRGYQVRVYLGTSQQYFVRRIIYNNNDTLFYANAEYHAIDPQMAYMHLWDGNAISPSTSYGSRAVIQYDTITVDQPWTEDMDFTSRFEIQTGMLHSIQNVSTNALFLHYMYDPLLANWFPGHVISSILPQYLAGTELQVESIDGSLTPVFVTGSLTSGSTRSAQDTTQNWNINQWSNYRFIDKTTGYERAIDSNNSNTLFFKQDLDIPPATSDQYQIIHDSDKLYMNGGNFSTMAQYSCRTNSWYQSQRFDEGVLNTAYVRFSGSYESMHPITSITRTGQVATVTTITGHPFKSGDQIFISGALGADSQYYNGFFTVTSSYGLATTLTGTTQPTQFTYWMPGTPSANASLNAHTTTVVFDTSKNWANNELVGQVVQIFSSSPTAPTSQYRKITANTSQSITVGLALSAVTSGIWGYNVLSSASFGTSWGLDNGTTTGTSSFSFTGSTTSGQPYIFVSASLSSSILGIPLGAPVTGSNIAAGTFYRSYDNTTNTAFYTMSISQNASSTLGNAIITSSLNTTHGHGSPTATGTTTVLTDVTKNWPVNFWAGARLKFVAGTGVGQETPITANTNNTLTFTAVATAPDVNTVYSILPIQPRNTTSTTSGAGGADLKWVYGTADTSITPTGSLGKYIWCFQAGSTMRLEKYNIATMQYEYPFIMPFHHMTGENLTTGTMYAYDGKGRIYIQPNATARIMYIDTDRDRSEVAGQIAAGMSTARLGRRMWIKKSEDGLDYLYIGRHNDTPWWRQLIFF
jgi:hypothetical protein